MEVTDKINDRKLNWQIHIKRQTGPITVSTDGGKNIYTFFANIFPLYIDFFSDFFFKAFYVYSYEMASCTEYVFFVSIFGLSLALR